MYAQVEKPKENKSRTSDNSVSQRKNRSKSPFLLVDNRLCAATQRKQQEMVNINPQATQTAKLQAQATQRMDINIGTGLEQHLRHEAWHLLQQKQLKATVQRVYDQTNVNGKKENIQAHQAHQALIEMRDVDIRLLDTINNTLTEEQFLMNLHSAFATRPNWVYVGGHGNMWKAGGDCRTLCNEFVTIARYFGIDAQVEDAGHNIWTSQSPIVGDFRTGNSANGTRWYFGEHFVVSANGEIYDVLFSPNPRPQSRQVRLTGDYPFSFYAEGSEWVEDRVNMGDPVINRFRSVGWGTSIIRGVKRVARKLSACGRRVLQSKFEGGTECNTENCKVDQTIEAYGVPVYEDDPEFNVEARGQPRRKQEGESLGRWQSNVKDKLQQTDIEIATKPVQRFGSPKELNESGDGDTVDLSPHLQGTQVGGGGDKKGYKTNEIPKVIRLVYFPYISQQQYEDVVSKKAESELLSSNFIPECITFAEPEIDNTTVTIDDPRSELERQENKPNPGPLTIPTLKAPFKDDVRSSDGDLPEPVRRLEDLPQTREHVEAWLSLMKALYEDTKSKIERNKHNEVITDVQVIPRSKSPYLELIDPSSAGQCDSEWKGIADEWLKIYSDECKKSEEKLSKM